MLSILIEIVEITNDSVVFSLRNGHLYEAFCWECDLIKGETRFVTLDHLSLGLEWMTVFKENSRSEKKLIKGSKSFNYFGYGQIEQIHPVIADFGDFKLELGNWTNDKGVIGEFIYWAIERLDILPEET